jgi:hypothetical protein
MTAHSTTRAIAVLLGPSLKRSRLRLGTAKRLRKIRTPMRFAGARCTISGLILVHRRWTALRTSASSKLARQFQFKSKLPPNRTLHQRLRLQSHLPQHLQRLLLQRRRQQRPQRRRPQLRRHQRPQLRRLQDPHLRQEIRLSQGRVPVPRLARKPSGKSLGGTVAAATP